MVDWARVGDHKGRDVAITDDVVYLRAKVGMTSRPVVSWKTWGHAVVGLSSHPRSTWNSWRSGVLIMGQMLKAGKTRNVRARAVRTYWVRTYAAREALTSSFLL